MRRKVHVRFGPGATGKGPANGHLASGLPVLSASQALKQPLPSPIHLWLKAGFQRVTVTVWDGSLDVPVLKDHVPDDIESGRGLFLVDYFSEQWGWFEPPRIGGKCIWCEITPESAARTDR